MNCNYCNGLCIKKGKVNGKQRYQCKTCKKYQQKTYIYNKNKRDEKLLINLNNEAVGISSISRIMKIPKTNVQRIIKKISEKLQLQVFRETQQAYEIDELRTFVGNKKNESWVIYAINKLSGKVINFTVGRRTTENIKKVIDTLLNLNPKKIYTDGLNTYKTLIPENIHSVFMYNTNKIERHNLTLRTHIKRLSRKTLCFSRSEEMLYHSVKLYLCG